MRPGRVARRGAAARCAATEIEIAAGRGRRTGSPARSWPEDLVDRYYWVQSPLWLGASGVPAVAGLPTTALDDAPRWRVIERRALGEDTLLVLDRP